MRAVATAGIVLTGTLLLAGCAMNPVTGRSELALYAVSDSEEVAVGRKAFPETMQRMWGEYDDESLRAYVDGVGQRLARVSHRPGLPYSFRVVNESVPNAFALPGGQIAITRGLLVDLENEAQLAAVLGHEIGHVTARHFSQAMQRGTLLNVGLQAVAIATSGSPYSALARQGGQLAATVLDSSYSREEERDADRLGVDYMVRAGYDPRGAVELQQYFARKSGEGDPTWLEGMFRTHPFSVERLRDIQAQIARQYPGQLSGQGPGQGDGRFNQAIAPLRAKRAAYAAYDQARKREQGRDREGAIALYRQAVELAPDQYLLHNGLGMAFLRAENHAQAKGALLRARELSSEYYETHLGLGVMHLKAGEFEEAKESLRQSMRLMPTLGGAFFLAEAQEKSGEYQEAFILYRQVAEADPRGGFGRTAAGRARELAARFGGR
ncbi:MAG: M48 family metalloprotease [Thermodesulfobacteriota bacterium]